MSSYARTISTIPIASLVVLAACQFPAAAQTQAPAPQMVEHYYNPGSHVVHTSYTCLDGFRTITLRNDERGRRRITSMSRSGDQVLHSVVDRVNAILDERLTAVSFIVPQCGPGIDQMLVGGRRNLEHAGIAIRWTMTSAEFDQILE